MKKTFFILLFLATILIFVKYWYSDYSLSYKVNKYNINSKYNDNRLYIEISKGDIKYNFDIYTSNQIKKYKISSIKEIKGENFECIYPTINGIDTYPLCMKDNIFIDYNLIDSDLLSDYKKHVNYNEETSDFVYYDNLSSDEYVALWNYKGFYIMNGENYNNVELFKNDRYDNNLTYLYNDTLYIADYDNEHTFNKLILLNLKTQKSTIIKLDYDIDFDSYFVGNVGKYIYLYDNKYSILYELNTKKKEIVIKCNNETGYVKYKDGKFVSCYKSEYKVDKIKYNTYTSMYNYSYNEGLFKIINDNKNIKQFINSENINILKESQNEFYFYLKNNFYKYIPSIGNKKIFYYYELEFNNNNMIFVYLDN